MATVPRRLARASQVVMVGKPKARPIYKSFIRWLLRWPNVWEITINYKDQTDQERIKELEEALKVAQEGLKTAAEVQYAQAEELKRLHRLDVEAEEKHWR